MDVITAGQYLQPSLNHLSVAEYVSPVKFESSPEIPEMIQDPFIKIDPFSRNNENNNFNKKFESIHVTKNDDEK